jgi:hypothetical protein
MHRLCCSISTQKLTSVTGRCRKTRTTDASSLAGLVHDTPGVAFYNFDPGVLRRWIVPGFSWWYRYLHGVVHGVMAREKIALPEALAHIRSRLLTVDGFPYPHPHTPRESDPVPVKYSAHLVRQAIAREAVVVTMQGRDKWLRLVPELNGYTHLYGPSSSKAHRVFPLHPDSGAMQDAARAVMQALK